jgi:hypothetical protein
MTIHAVPRDELDQSELPEGVLANGAADKTDDESAGGHDKEESVVDRVAAIERNRADVLKEFASQEAALLNTVRSKLVVARLVVSQLEDAEASILHATGGDKPAKADSKPGVAKASPARKAATTRKARANAAAKDKGPSFKAKLIEWVTKHPKSRVEDIAEAFPEAKRPFISSTLYLAKQKSELKSTGDRGSMKWSAA